MGRRISDTCLIMDKLLISVRGCRKFHSIGGGLKPGVSILGGFLCEYALGFFLHIIVMWSIGAPSSDHLSTVLNDPMF